MKYTVKLSVYDFQELVILETDHITDAIRAATTFSKKLWGKKVISYTPTAIEFCESTDYPGCNLVAYYKTKKDTSCVYVICNK